MIYQRSNYRKLIVDINRVLSQFITISNQYSMKQRKYLRIFNFIMYSYEILIFSGNNGLIYIIKDYINGNQVPSQLILIYILHSIAASTWLIFYNFIIESCIHLQSYLTVMLYDIDSIDENRPDLLKRIYNTRLTYIEGIQITRKLDCYLSIFITCFYVQSTIICYLNFVEIFHDNTPFLLKNLFISGQAFYIIFITCHFVYVNCLSVKCYDQVYQLSLCSSISQQVTTEVNFFLDRINRQDLGFTFANLFVITPSFVSSLATISLTLALATPDLFKEK
ncbi:uncharacterized protein LOC128389800 isoform X2 [Panonychus citri]|uniref:uncharacterized protein LOC128389800 isoform X2 n=1 Tax=Panonychus citri TaxID=50023 RepID=UPI0023073E64|nr:uncharacterized protein LOC128389800 isoform X2 [Panonychus citri]